jgi:hypothetical protein
VSLVSSQILIVIWSDAAFVVTSLSCVRVDCCYLCTLYIDTTKFFLQFLLEMYAWQHEWPFGMHNISVLLSVKFISDEHNGFLQELSVFLLQPEFSKNFFKIFFSSWQLNYLSSLNVKLYTADACFSTQYQAYSLLIISAPGSCDMLFFCLELEGWVTFTNIKDVFFSSWCICNDKLQNCICQLSNVVCANLWLHITI